VSDSTSSDSPFAALDSAANNIAGIGRVVRAEFVTPRMRRITVTCDELAAWPPGLGWNLSFRGYFSKPGFYDEVFLPPLENGTYGDTGAFHQEHAVVRIYTIRRLDVEARELDVDFVLHEHGLASKWAESAEEGSGFGFLIGTLAMMAAPLPEVDCLVLVGDETAIPAIANSLAELPEGRRAIAVLEVEDAGEEQRLETRGDVTVQWVHREGLPAGRSGKLPEAVRSLPWPKGCVHAFVAAEAKEVGQIRLFLRNERTLVSGGGGSVAGVGGAGGAGGPGTYVTSPYWRLGSTTTDEARSMQQLMQDMSNAPAGTSMDDFEDARFARFDDD
jgi:NADPH-dependent ferric siderophore reductase